MKPLFRQCCVTAAVCCNVVAFGSCYGFPAILLQQLQDKNSPLQISKETGSWIVAVLPLCTLIGNVVTPLLLERFGRKIASYTMTLLMIAGWFSIILATSVELLLIGRILQGLSCGIIVILRSILIGEYTSPKHRGAFLMTVSLSQAFGIFLVHLLGSLLSWQMTALITVLFANVSLLMTIYTPESPSWLLTRGKLEETRRVFLWLRGAEEESELESMIKARLAFEKAKVEEKPSSQIKKFFHLVRQTEFFKPILIVFHFNVMMHLAGGTTMASYSMVILSLLMGPEAKAHFWMVFLDAQRTISNTAAVFIIQKIKRRTMVFSATTLCILSQASMAVYAYWTRTQGKYSYMWIPAILINIQMLSVAVGMVPMPNVITGEIFPLEHRGISGMITALSGGFMMFIVVKTFPMLLDTMGLEGTFGLCSVILLVNLLILWYLLPETKGKTLQEIENEFRDMKINHEEVQARKSLHSIEQMHVTKL